MEVQTKWLSIYEDYSAINDLYKFCLSEDNIQNNQKLWQHSVARVNVIVHGAKSPARCDQYLCLRLLQMYSSLSLYALDSHNSLRDIDVNYCIKTQFPHSNCIINTKSAW